jgi:hypothetical protein
LLSEAYVKALGADFLPTPLQHFPLNNSFPFSNFSLPKASHTKRPKVKPQKAKAKKQKPLFLL